MYAHEKASGPTQGIKGYRGRRLAKSTDRVRLRFPFLAKLSFAEDLTNTPDGKYGSYYTF
jgi:hypothetical protein